jgi:cytochrome c-type biogenesis protein CcmH
MKAWMPILLMFTLLPFTALAVTDPHEPLEDAELQARYERLVRELRCLVCQNESVAESNAELARDLRGQVRTMLKAGASDREIKTYMTDRYGDFVLYRPPVRSDTALLWAGPFLILLAAAIGLGMTIARRARMADAEDDE